MSRRAYVSGAGISELMDRLDGARSARGGSPLGATRSYPSAAGAIEGAPRLDLTLNRASLQTLREVPDESLNYVADTMRYGDFAHISFSVGSVATANSTPILTRPDTKRIFLLIQNTHATQDLFVGFGGVPSSTNGIKIPANGSLLLDAVVAQNDVYLSGSANATTGLLTYCNQAFGKS